MDKILIGMMNMQEVESDKWKWFQVQSTIMLLPAHNVNKQIQNCLRYDAVKPEIPKELTVIDARKITPRPREIYI
jgi:hypothetical protein